MREVLISIQPKWCELIASGKKTVEVRKTRPKIDTPFKCYIYCTNNKRQYLRKLETHCQKIFFTENRDVLGRTEKVNSLIGDVTTFWENGGYNGKVIGEFVCDSIMPYCRYEIVSGVSEAGFEELTRATQLSRKELYEYCGEKDIYCWHISDLVIYDKPKELSEFRYYNPTVKFEAGYPTPTHEITRPPQSWCYVELLKGGAE